MRSWHLEHERPGEWLRWLAGEPDAYHVLVTSTGGLARAAYRLASALCRAQRGAGELPTLRELQAAALLLAGVLGVSESLPITSLLASDCEARSSPLVRPVSTPPTGRRSSAPALRRAS